MKYDLVQQIQTEIKSFTTELTFTTKNNGQQDPNHASSVLFSHSNLESQEFNLNEHESQDEEAFVNSQLVMITLEFYEDPRGERFMLNIRRIGNFDKMIVE